jgi:tRNA-splicing ligase RtcB
MGKKAKSKVVSPPVDDTLVINGKTLLAHGWNPGRAMGMAIAVAERLTQQGVATTDILERLNDIRHNPSDYVDGDYQALAAALYVYEPPADLLRNTPVPYNVFGASMIESGAMDQLDIAVRLPVAMQGALMPDAHPGYGLPIGGVLAVENAVIPYAVGVDIGCRMHLTAYALPAKELGKSGTHRDVVEALNRQTAFGKGSILELGKRVDHDVMDDPAWSELKMLQMLKGKAWSQLGSSGSGNHFVDVGVMVVESEDNPMRLAIGEYVTILSHSGSRGLGATIADHFTNVAMDAHPNLPSFAKHLAWLSMDSEDGQAYWTAMNLAGAYAKANHETIHERLAKALGWESDLVATVQNHHNFAWRETLPDGRVGYVHRKGATPAGEGVLGIIPGSMTTVGKVVVGKGNPASLNSASHGAGRKASRAQARANITKERFSQFVKEAGITLIGGALDEGPHAYKNIERVIAAQSELVDVVATFTPRFVKMAGDDGGPRWRKNKKGSEGE